jgi:hypothetical protein
LQQTGLTLLARADAAERADSPTPALREEEQHREAAIGQKRPSTSIFCGYPIAARGGLPLLYEFDQLTGRGK